MTASSTCPFCDTTVAYDLPPHRIVCTRCGESFVPTETAVEPTSEVLPPIAATPTWKAFAVPAAIGGLMLAGVFYFGVTAILKPNASRDAATTDTATTTEPKRASLWPPSALSGLKYLPRKSELAIAVQPAAFAEYAAREGKDPVEMLAGAGVPKVLWESLGVKFQDVSQLVAGLTLSDDGLFPRGVIALILRKPPADEAAFLKALKSEPITGGNGVFRVAIRNVPLVMKRENETTYLFAFEVDDLAAKPDLGPLSPSLQASLGQLSPSSYFWIAADERNWSKKPLIALLAKSELSAKLPKLDDLRAAAVGLSLEPKPTWTTAVKRGSGDWLSTAKPVE